MSIDYELLKNIMFNSISYLVVLLFGMILYRFSVLYKIKETNLIKKQAFTDPLTRKFNRHKFLSIINENINKKTRFAVCFMDLDGFKHINDTLGHDAGDLLLVELSELLEKNLPRNCTAFRLGGDEFALIIDNVKTIQEISEILDNLKVALNEPIIIKSTRIILEYSLGVSIYPTDGKTRNELMTFADDAMYYIKENGKNSYYFHNEALKAKLDNKKKMEIDLKLAIKNEEFDIQFQPRINLNNLDEVYLETLIYWNHPVLGKLNSEYFISQAEEMGIVINLDHFVLEKSCEKINELKKLGYENIKISMNISNIHSKRHEFADRLFDILTSYKLSRGSIQFEFTDKIDIKYLQSYKYLIDKISDAGSTVCISNLEIKFDSLKLFRELKINEIKINSGYIYDNSNFNTNILKDIIKLCKDLDYLTTIICIEDEKQLKYALNSCVDKIQGNYLFKRIESENLEKFLTCYSDFKKDILKRIQEISKIN